MQSYNLSLHYRSGKKNVDADALSRIPWIRDRDRNDNDSYASLHMGHSLESSQDDHEINHCGKHVELSTNAITTIPSDVVDALFTNAVTKNSNILEPYVTLNQNNIDPIVPIPSDQVKKMTTEHWVSAQQADPIIKQILDLLKKHKIHQIKLKNIPDLELKKLLSM